MTIDKDELSVAKLPDPKISTAFPQLVESEELSMNRIQDDESSAQCQSIAFNESVSVTESIIQRNCNQVLLSPMNPLLICGRM